MGISSNVAQMFIGLKHELMRFWWSAFKVTVTSQDRFFGQNRIMTNCQSNRTNNGVVTCCPQKVKGQLHRAITEEEKVRPYVLDLTGWWRRLAGDLVLICSVPSFPTLLSASFSL